MIFCTLFDSNYLDKGLALCKSLNKVCNDFKLYILAFDDVTYDILCELNIEHIIPIREKQILDEKMKDIKAERTRTEYCWTCTPVIIQYVLDHYHEESCTYIDADMYFYKSPVILFDEIEKSGCNVSIIGHRFANKFMKATNEKQHGKYCVEFNTFMNNTKGREVLEWWKQKCLDSCTMKLHGVGFGDQKYLDNWKESFEGIHEIENAGAGVAPWNLADYKFLQKKDDSIELIYRKIRCDLIFYHFQNFKFINNETVDIGVYNEIGIFDKELINILYSEYASELVELRKMLVENYQLQFRGYESRKENNRWKYTGVRDLLVYIAVFINTKMRTKNNIRKVSGEDWR